jgi:hypothetical protein
MVTAQPKFKLAQLQRVRNCHKEGYTFVFRTEHTTHRVTARKDGALSFVMGSWSSPEQRAVQWPLMLAAAMELED